MARNLILLNTRRLAVRVAVSDCWTTKGKPIRFACSPLEVPAGMSASFTQRIVLLWFAIWIFVEAKRGAA